MSDAQNERFSLKESLYRASRNTGQVSVIRTRLITTRKRSLGQGNMFTGVFPREVPGPGRWVPGSQGGAWPQGGSSPRGPQQLLMQEM